MPIPPQERSFPGNSMGPLSLKLPVELASALLSQVHGLAVAQASLKHGTLYLGRPLSLEELHALALSLDNPNLRGQLASLIIDAQETLIYNFTTTQLDCWIKVVLETGNMHPLPMTVSREDLAGTLLQVSRNSTTSFSNRFRDAVSDIVGAFDFDVIQLDLGAAGTIIELIGYFEIRHAIPKLRNLILDDRYDADIPGDVNLQVLAARVLAGLATEQNEALLLEVMRRPEGSAPSFVAFAERFPDRMEEHLWIALDTAARGQAEGSLELILSTFVQYRPKEDREILLRLINRLLRLAVAGSPAYLKAFCTSMACNETTGVHVSCCSTRCTPDSGAADTFMLLECVGGLREYIPLPTTLQWVASDLPIAETNLLRLDAIETLFN